MEGDASIAGKLPKTPASMPSPEDTPKDLNIAKDVIAQDLEAGGASTPYSTDDARQPSEETPLLGGHQGAPAGDEENEESTAAAGKFSDETTWQQEAKIIGSYTLPQIPTFLLQYSLVLATTVALGHYGTVELGAASLGAMSANVTGMAVFSGLATSLDTLCAQAYGSGKKKLVGLQVQRMVYFMWAISIPIGVLWYSASPLLHLIIPEPEIADLASRYLRIVWFGMPGYAIFTAGKRYLQAQGNFAASFYVILVVASLNGLLTWFLVWHLGWGFDGAPIAFLIMCHMLWTVQVGYVYFISGRECWPGFTWQAFHNWGPMIRLAVPGLVMVEAEVMSFELLTLASSYFGAVALAANTVLFTTINIAFQVAWPLGVSTSTRVAHLIGAQCPKAAKVSFHVGFVVACCIGVFNFAILSGFKSYVPRLFSDDPRVWARADEVLPLAAVFLLFDATASCCGGTLRGLGRQSVGSYVQLFCYYVIGMPISLFTAFKADWGLHGLWGGLMIALLCVTIIEYIFIRTTNWHRSVDDAIQRNELG